MTRLARDSRLELLCPSWSCGGASRELSSQYASGCAPTNAGCDGRYREVRLDLVTAPPQLRTSWRRGKQDCENDQEERRQYLDLWTLREPASRKNTGAARTPCLTIRG